ncbi:hypothetical protein HK104_002893 [Borealophlyctis nickersoniae]|nr:hypothetical protein HK104_002893 [Borealophlyctis nickersoniae]
MNPTPQLLTAPNTVTSSSSKRAQYLLLQNLPDSLTSDNIISALKEIKAEICPAEPSTFPQEATPKKVENADSKTVADGPPDDLHVTKEDVDAWFSGKDDESITKPPDALAESSPREKQTIVHWILGLQQSPDAAPAFDGAIVELQGNGLDNFLVGWLKSNPSSFGPEVKVSEVSAEILQVALGINKEGSVNGATLEVNRADILFRLAKDFKKHNDMRLFEHIASLVEYLPKEESSRHFQLVRDIGQLFDPEENPSIIQLNDEQYELFEANFLLRCIGACIGNVDVEAWQKENERQAFLSGGVTNFTSKMGAVQWKWPRKGDFRGGAELLPHEMSSEEALARITFSRNETQLSLFHEMIPRTAGAPFASLRLVDELEAGAHLLPDYRRRGRRQPRAEGANENVEEGGVEQENQMMSNNDETEGEANVEHAFKPSTPVATAAEDAGSLIHQRGEDSASQPDDGKTSLAVGLQRELDRIARVSVEGGNQPSQRAAPSNDADARENVNAPMDVGVQRKLRCIIL